MYGIETVSYTHLIYHMGGIPVLPIEYGKWNRQIHIRFVCLISPLMEKMVSPET